MNSSPNIIKQFLTCTSMMLALLLLTPTFISILSLTNPSSSINLIMENPLEEEKEEKTSGEEDVKEIKEFPLPSVLLSKDDFILSLAIMHQYTFRPYSSILSVLDLPPEYLS